MWLQITEDKGTLEVTRLHCCLAEFVIVLLEVSRSKSSGAWWPGLSLGTNGAATLREMK